MDFGHWKEWEDDSDDDMSRFDKFSEVRLADLSDCVDVRCSGGVDFNLFSALR